MRHPRRPPLVFDKIRTPFRSYQPRLEEMETRLLPGETVGLAFLASFDLFGRLHSLAVHNQELAVFARVARSTEESGLIVRAGDLDQTGPLPKGVRTVKITGAAPFLWSGSWNNQGENSLASESAALFTGNADLKLQLLFPLTTRTMEVAISCLKIKVGSDLLM